MSADNWGICPRCKKLTDQKNKERLLDVKKIYGKVPAEEYIQLATEAARPIELKETLREDYNIGTNKVGTFTIDYKCSCCVCGFKYQYKYSENIKYWENTNDRK